LLSDMGASSGSWANVAMRKGVVRGLPGAARDGAT